MNTNLKNLLSIQEFDKRAAELEEELEKIKKKELKIVEVIELKKQQLLEIREEKEEIEQDKTSKNELLEDTIENLKKLEIKMNSATTEKQMKAVNTEIDIAKTNKTILEEKIESLKEQIEVKDKDIKELEERYAQLQKTLKEHKAKFDERRKQIKEELKHIEKNKENLRETVDPQLLKRYEQLNKWTKGTSIAAVKNGACYGCFMKLTPQTVTNLDETDDIIFCPNCGRILYKEENSEND